MKMKQTQFWILWLSLACLVIGSVFYAGVILECEFPYFITLAYVRHAKTMSGDDATSVIARRLSIAPDDVEYHRCSFCKNYEGKYPKDSIRIQVLYASSNVYVFAYNTKKEILLTADLKTANTFTEIGTIVGSETEGN
jgi:hypothetical protein